jgi:hypothetical protein
MMNLPLESQAGTSPPPLSPTLRRPGRDLGRYFLDFEHCRAASRMHRIDFGDAAATAQGVTTTGAMASAMSCTKLDLASKGAA